MRLLLDTHLLLWAASEPERLPAAARAAIDNSVNELVFSAASIWEVAIKQSLGREDFRADPHVLRRGLIENSYTELPVTGRHAASVTSLPLLHRDPFDRLLIAQANVEGITLMTAERDGCELSGLDPESLTVPPLKLRSVDVAAQVLVSIDEPVRR